MRSNRTRRHLLPRRQVLCLTALLGASLLAGACSSVRTTEAGTIGVNRKQSMSSLVPAKDLNAGAAQAYQQVIGKAKTEGALNTDSAYVKRVRAISARLIPQTAVFRKDAPGWKWETNVIKSDQINAWAMPGGKIAVYTGIIEKLKLTDDELAAIMGHEIAHALREHGRERASRVATQGLAVGVIGAAAGLGSGATGLANMALNVTFNLPNSRVQEAESDRIGVELAARAGYNPAAAVELWKKMDAASGGNKPPAFLSTHPTNDSRIKDLQKYSAQVMPLYNASKGRR